MVIQINCNQCGELIPFNIDTVGCSSPLEIGDVNEIIKEELELGFDIKPDKLKIISEMFCKDMGYKEVRFYEKCPKCGSQTALHLCVPLS